MSDAISVDQLAMAGKAARRLLQVAWSDSRRNDSTIIVGIDAVGKTVSSDPVASVALLKTVIEPSHLHEHGYRELSWLVHHLEEIAGHDIDFVVDVYQAAYAWQEKSDATTQIGNSVLMPLSSNKRQDYQGAWHLLEEFIPKLMQSDIQAAIQAVARAVEGYVRRDHAKPPERGGALEVTFDVDGIKSRLLRDSSLYWFRGGYVSPVDAPALMTRFEQELEGVAAAADADSRFSMVIRTLMRETAAAGLWGIVLKIASKQPERWAQTLAPLARAPSVLESADLLLPIGSFIGSSFDFLTESDKSALEQAILNLTGPGSVSRKSRLAGCIPRESITTASMREYRDGLDRSGGPELNEPLFNVTPVSTPFDSDAYLKSQGVSLEGDHTVLVRNLIKDVEQLPAAANTSDINAADINAQTRKLSALHLALKRYAGSIPSEVLENGEGVLATKSADLATRSCARIRPPFVYSPLRRVLLACANSMNPHFIQSVEDGFQENLSWGGPAARVASAQGLLLLARCRERKDPAMLGAIRKLARDRVAPVRFNLMHQLHLIQRWDREWVWAQINRVISREPTRGVVSGAMEALGRVAHTDLHRAIGLAKKVITRYAANDESGMASCRDSARSLIFDIYIYEANPEALQFMDNEILSLRTNSRFFCQLIARYSDRLLVDDDSRTRAIDFYSHVVRAAFEGIDEATARNNGRRFDLWLPDDHALVRAMYDVLHEVSLRMYFASGANSDGRDPSSVNAPKRERLYRETTEILNRMAGAVVAAVAHRLIEALEVFIPYDPPGVFALVARSVRSSEMGGYGFEHGAAKLIVGIVEKYLADYRSIFIQPDRLADLLISLDVFVRAGWPEAQALTFRLGEIWR